MALEEEPIRLAREPPFRLAGLSVTPATRQVAWAGQSRTLEPRVMQVLAALAGREGEVVGRDEMIRLCWDGRVVGDNAINRVISILRQLGAETNAFSLETVTKVGYRLVEAASADFERAEAIRRLRIRVGAIAAVLLAACVIFTWSWWIWGPAPPTGQNGRVEVARLGTLQNDAELLRLSSGVEDSLVRMLTRTGIDTVRAGAAQDGDAGPEFRVVGSVDRRGPDLVVNTQVVDRRSGLVLGSVQAARPATAAPDLADQAALNVVASLDCALEDRKRARRPLAPSVLALYISTCDALTREGNPQRMLESARRLVAAAPDLAIVHALYGIAQANAASTMTDAAPEAEALRRAARISAARALKLDPATPKAYIALANSYPSGTAWIERERNLLRARQIDPNLNPGRVSYIVLLREVGRLKEAAEAAGRLINSGDPRTLNGARMETIFLHAQLGEANAAREALAVLARSDPDTAAGVAWMLASTWEDPRAALAHLHAMGPDGPYRPHTFACVETFLRALPERTAHRARGLPAVCDGVPGDRRVQMLARQGDLDGAYAEAGGVLKDANVSAAFLFYPSMKAFRADPRFPPLTERLGLADYWRRSGHWPDFCGEPGLAYDCRQALKSAEKT